MFHMMKLPSLGQGVIMRRNKSYCHQGFLDVLPELRKNFLVSTYCKFPTGIMSGGLFSVGFPAASFPRSERGGGLGPSSLDGVGFFFSFFLSVGYFEGNVDLAHFSLCTLTQLEGEMFIV